MKSVAFCEVRVGICVVLFLFGFYSCFALVSGDPKLTLGNPAGENADRFNKVPPYFFATMDAAGFSDWIYYGPSEIHEAGSHHEVLSGEWAAAIYYDGINTELIDP